MGEGEYPEQRENGQWTGPDHERSRNRDRGKGVGWGRDRERGEGEHIDKIAGLQEE